MSIVHLALYNSN